MNIITKLFFLHSAVVHRCNVLDYKVYLDDGTSLNDIFDYNEFSKLYNGAAKILLISMILFKQVINFHHIRRILVVIISIKLFCGLMSSNVLYSHIIHNIIKTT